MFRLFAFYPDLIQHQMIEHCDPAKGSGAVVFEIKAQNSFSVLLTSAQITQPVATGQSGEDLCKVSFGLRASASLFEHPLFA